MNWQGMLFVCEDVPEERRETISTTFCYIDGKGTELLEALRLPRPRKRLEIQFSTIPGFRFLPPHILRIGQTSDGLGEIIRELYHWFLLPGASLYRIFPVLFEGLASYYRIVLSADHQGDYWDNSRQYLTDNFNAINPHDYDSSSEFIAFLRHKFSSELVPEMLSNALYDGDYSEVKESIGGGYIQNFTEQIEEYSEHRNEWLRGSPNSVNRYWYYTHLVDNPSR